MKKTITVTDMSCNHCKMTIENSVKKIPGIKEVMADPETKLVTVTFDENETSLDSISMAITDAGYTVNR